MALQHWKIFTPGMFATCKTNQCTLEGNFSALLRSKGKKILRTSWRICVLYKHQELTNSSLWFSPPAFFFSPLISSHLSFSWPSSLWSTFKIILNWLHHFPRLCKCVSAVQQRGTKALRFFFFFLVEKLNSRPGPSHPLGKGWDSFGFLPPDSLGSFYKYWC